MCIALYNSYVLYKLRNKNPTCSTFMQYVLNVSEQWASLRSHPEGAEGEDPPAAAEPSRAADFSVAGYRTRRDDPPCRLSAQMDGHFLERFPQVTGTKKEKPYRPCRVCQRKAEDKGAKGI